MDPKRSGANLERVAKTFFFDNKSTVKGPNRCFFSRGVEH